MLKETFKIQSRYNRYSYFYDFLEAFPEKLFFDKLRKKIIPGLSGNILEIGVGTGKNLKYYSNSARVTAIDFSEKMIGHAGRKLKKLNKNNISLIKADAQNLPYLDNSFDIVVSTFVFCSVPDPVLGFKEANRVLKKNGRAIFFEHVKSMNKVKGALQDFFNPITVNIFGFNINRKTWINIKKGGFTIANDDKVMMNDVLRIFTCKK